MILLGVRKAALVFQDMSFILPGPSFILDEHPWFWTLSCAYLKCYDCWRWINKYILRLKRRQIHPQSRLQKEIRGENLKGSSCQPPGQHPLTTVNCTHPTGNTNKHTDIRPYNITHCHRGKQSQRHASFTKSKWTSLLVLRREGVIWRKSNERP